MENSKRGLLIVLEGLDRCGKTSQVARLTEYFKSQNEPVERMNFPDRRTILGQTLDAYLKNQVQLPDESIHLIYSANRWEKQDYILEKIQNGTNLIIDRYAYSGVAYSAAKGLNFDWCKQCDKGIYKPDIVFYLNVSEEVQNKRASFGEERYEKKEFQLKVRKQYENFLQTDNFQIIDANLEQEQVFQQISKVIEDHIIQNQQYRKLQKLWI